MLSREESEKTVERLKKYPEILETIKELIDLVDGENIKRADDAELALIPEVRGLGKQILDAWAKHRITEEVKEKREEGLRCHSKKK